MRQCSLINVKTDENLDLTRDIARAPPQGCVATRRIAQEAKQRVTRRKVGQRSGHTVPCRYSSRYRHVTPNIGREPKLITTTSILLRIPLPLFPSSLSTLQCPVYRHKGGDGGVAQKPRRRRSTFRSSCSLNRLLLYPLRFVSRSFRLLAQVRRKLGQ